MKTLFHPFVVFVAVFVFAAFALNSSQSRADEIFGPSGYIGGGFETSAPGQTMSVFLRVDASGLTSRDSDDLTFGVVARVRTDFMFSVASDGQRIPYLDFEFVPYTKGMDIDGTTLGVRFVPLHISRSVRLDQSANIRVDVAGIEANLFIPLDKREKFVAFAKIAADAVGYKLATYLSDRGNFHGVDIAALRAELGAVLGATGPAKVTVSIGGSIDLNLGGNVGRGFAVQSDMAAYTEVTLDILNFLKLFVRASLNATGNSAYSFDGERRLMVGAAFLF